MVSVTLAEQHLRPSTGIIKSFSNPEWPWVARSHSQLDSLTPVVFCSYSVLLCSCCFLSLLCSFSLCSFPAHVICFTLHTCLWQRNHVKSGKVSSGESMPALFDTPPVCVFMWVWVCMFRLRDYQSKGQTLKEFSSALAAIARTCDGDKTFSIAKYA